MDASYSVKSWAGLLRNRLNISNAKPVVKLPMPYPARNKSFVIIWFVLSIVRAEITEVLCSLGLEY
jgi:hypothetical protein